MLQCCYGHSAMFMFISNLLNKNLGKICAVFFFIKAVHIYIPTTREVSSSITSHTLVTVIFFIKYPDQRVGVSESRLKQKSLKAFMHRYIFGMEFKISPVL